MFNIAIYLAIHHIGLILLLPSQYKTPPLSNYIVYTTPAIDCRSLFKLLDAIIDCGHSWLLPMRSQQSRGWYISAIYISTAEEVEAILLCVFWYIVERKGDEGEFNILPV